VDAPARTRELLDRGDAIEEIVRELRDEGFSMIDSMSALIKTGGLPFVDAEAAVIDSPVWADQRDQVTTNRWVHAPELPDPAAAERLQEACRELPRIAELRITGSHMTRHDGSSKISTAIAIVLDPPAKEFLDPEEMAETTEILTRLNAAWSPAGHQGSLWVSSEVLAGHKEHCVAIYSRP
jgi:hypothetical protein